MRAVESGEKHRSRRRTKAGARKAKSKHPNRETPPPPEKTHARTGDRHSEARQWNKKIRRGRRRGDSSRAEKSPTPEQEVITPKPKAKAATRKIRQGGEGSDPKAKKRKLGRKALRTRKKNPTSKTHRTEESPVQNPARKRQKGQASPKRIEKLNQQNSGAHGEIQLSPLPNRRTPFSNFAPASNTSSASGAMPSDITVEKVRPGKRARSEPRLTAAEAWFLALFAPVNNYRYLTSATIDAIRRARSSGRWKFVIVHNSGTRRGTRALVFSEDPPSGMAATICYRKRNVVAERADRNRRSLAAPDQRRPRSQRLHEQHRARHLSGGRFRPRPADPGATRGDAS